MHLTEQKRQGIWLEIEKQMNELQLLPGDESSLLEKMMMILRTSAADENHKLSGLSLPDLQTSTWARAQRSVLTKISGKGDSCCRRVGSGTISTKFIIRELIRMT